MKKSKNKHEHDWKYFWIISFCECGEIRGELLDERINEAMVLAVKQYIRWQNGTKTI